MSSHYSGKLDSLNEIFPGSDIQLDTDNLHIDGKAYPIIDDVIILLDPEYYPESVKARLADPKDPGQSSAESGAFSESIQYTFGAEWTRFSEIWPEYDRVFDEYFDIVNLEELEDKRVCDLGCGTGRWAYFLTKNVPVRELVMVDFSEAIFVARNNLRYMNNTLFFMGDLQRLPFKEDFADFLYCLGVLLTLPSDQLQEIRKLKKYAKKLLIYLYYDLENRPAWFRTILAGVTAVRKVVSKIRNKTFRDAFTWSVAAFVYAPLIGLGKLLDPFGLSKYVPLYPEHHYMTFRWWRLLAYDRFFTSIEQRVSTKEIMTLEDTFSEVIISPKSAFWHFLCVR